MRPLLRNHIRAVAFVALAAVFSTACVKQNESGVGLVKFDSEAVFGKSAGEGDLPGFGPTGPFSDGFSLPDLPVRDLIRRVAERATGPCPEAKLADFPKASATPAVKGLPPVGIYQWKRALSVQKQAGALSARPFALESRAIRRVVVESDHNFTFEMLSPDPFIDSNTVITTFRVNSNPELLHERTLPARTIGVVPVPGTDVRVRPLTDVPGVYILKIETQNPNGGVVSTFQPVVEMMILPLDGGILRTGETFRSVGIDATTGTVLVNNGTTGRTSRIDACGEIVEGYAVTLAQTFTGDIDLADPTGAVARYATRNQTRSVDYIFATQYGLLPIGESLSIGDLTVDPVAYIGKWELGGLTPKPLTDSLK